MTFTINGTVYGIKFNYRVIRALMAALGMTKIEELKEADEKFEIFKVHEYIHTAIITSITTKSGPPEDAPTVEDVEFAMDENESAFVQFFEGFMTGISNLIPSGKTVEKELAEGN